MLARLQLSQEHAEWLETVRKIPCETAAEMGVVSKDANIAFQYRRSGATAFIKIRAPKGESGKTFWIEPAGVDLCFWNEDCLREPSASDKTPLVITEGEIDALSFAASGVTHVVSVPNGAPAKPGEGEIVPVDDRQFAYLWRDGKLKAEIDRFSQIILATDTDVPGRILRDELSIRLGRTRCWYVQFPEGCKDANEVVQKHGLDVLQNLLADAKPIVPSRLVSFSEIPKRADAQSYSVGWRDLDQHFQLLPPQLIVVTGRPNAGKSQWVLAVCCNLARLHGFKGAILQFEDNPDRNRRDLMRYARAWSGQERNGIDEDPAKWVERMFLTISPNEDLNEEADFDLEWLKSAIEEAATRHGCKWVVVDPWNEVEHLWGRQDTEASYLNRALRHLKRIARRFQISLFIVAHPTKEGGKSNDINDVDLYDINGGAVWNNKADLGVIVWAPDTKFPERIIKVAKSKDFLRMGRPGSVRMEFNAENATFSCKGSA